MTFVKNSLILISLVIVTLLSVSSPVFAAGKCDAGRGALPVPTWYKYVPLNADCTVNKNHPSIKDNEGRLIILILLGVFDIVLFIAGFVAVIFVVYGGFKFLTSTGEPQKIAAARTTIFNALIGLAVALIASRAVAFIGGSFF